MVALLRFIGILNAAVWFGAAVFFTFGIAPAFFTPEMKRLFGGPSPAADYYSGMIAQLVLSRYFALHYCCGAIALAHQLAEWVYLGKALQRLTFSVLIGVLVLNLTGGLWLKPRLSELNKVRYGRSEQYSAAQRQQAIETFPTWHMISMLVNLGVLVGLGTFAWRIVMPANGPRFVSGKFRS